MKKNRFEHVCVIGLGYIGLPTAATLAAHNIKVTGVDIDNHAIEMINKGKIHIIEPDLDIMVKQVVDKGFLSAQTTPVKADAYIIAVPTPFKDNHEPDLSYIESATKALAPYLEKNNLIILESTSPVGATEQMIEWLSILRPDLNFPNPNKKQDNVDIFVAYCPERVLPGKVIYELINNDRIIGGVTEQCSQAAISLYETFVKGKCIKTNARTAEMCKLTENAFRDVNIAFANELSIICDKLDINVWELIELANRHPRVNILQPGPGVGGHCIAVDPWFIVSKTPEQARLIRTAREVNDSKLEWVFKRIAEDAKDFYEKNKVKVKIIILGLAFKPDIDDLRESPSLEIAKKLANLDIIEELILVEPNIKENIEKFIYSNKVKHKVSISENFEGELIYKLVAHKEFKEMNIVEKNKFTC